MDGSAHKITFMIEMPDAIAIPHGSDFTFWLPDNVRALDDVEIRMFPESEPIRFKEGKQFVYFRFWQKVTTLRLPFTDAVWDVVSVITGNDSRDVANDPPMIEAYRTVVQTSTLISDPNDIGQVSDAFNRCIEWVTKFCRSFSTATGDLIAPITAERLPSLVLYSTADLASSFRELRGLVLHYNLPDHFPRQILDASEIERIHIILQRQSVLDPFSLAQEHIVEARRFFDRLGDYGDAVIHCQLAAEVFLDGVLMYLLWEDGHSPDEVVSIFERGLASRIRREYSPRLGGNWNTTTHGAVGRFDAHLMKLRGRVVHAGYRPTSEEVLQAFDAYQSIQKFVKDRLAAKRSRYPRSALMVLGKPGFERRGSWNAKMDEFLNETRDEPDWGSAFRDWREILNSLRS